MCAQVICHSFLWIESSKGRGGELVEGWVAGLEHKVFVLLGFLKKKSIIMHSCDDVTLPTIPIKYVQKKKKKL